MKHITIQDFPESERPYERAERYGVRVLSDAELLAVILRSGSRGKTSIELAREVLGLYSDQPGLLSLYHARQPDLMKLDGIGRVKSLELLCITELAKRMTRAVKHPGRRMREPEDVAGFFMEELKHLETEHFYLALFDASGTMICYEELFIGTINMSIASPREAMILALKHNAASMIILHNHPSGDPTPSKADAEVTRAFTDACGLIGIPLLDHIIIGCNTYVSFLDSGLLFEKNDHYSFGKDT